MAGRLVEISGQRAVANLTVAFGLVLEAQKRNEPVAWVTLRQSTFYPPDVADSGISLAHLAVVRVPDTPLLTKLVGLARKHATAVVVLTEKNGRTSSVSSLISLRAEARRNKDAPCELEVAILKDKRRGPGRLYHEVCRAPAGLR